MKPSSTAALIGGIGLAALALVGMVVSPLATAPEKALPPSRNGAFAVADKAGPKPAPAPAPTPAAPKDEGLVIKRILPITGPIKYGEWHWDDKGVADGPLVVTVDLDARVLSVFKGGYEIGATAVLLGTSEKPTPLGVFPVKWKHKDHYSSTYDSAPMPYTMNLTADGVAIHGTKVEKGYASHGCIGVPNSFGAKLFAIAPVGTRVYITRGKMSQLGDSLI
ncbi:L,D-transpeptidase family protein [Novosphingobium sp.]|uniref:L,D-transpeptidase family protein n=1 Tax=Novosphingobium sp. TaxID=1874826 RepID=UPI0025D72648|nr:L,D-transpeptidase family protein [Novosphingobium sp.]